MLSLKQLLLTAAALSLLSGCANSGSSRSAGAAFNVVNYTAATAAEIKSAREKKSQDNLEQDLQKMRRPAR